MVLTAPFRGIARLWRRIAAFFMRLTAGPRRFLFEDIEDTPLPETIEKVVVNPGGLLEHIGALRWHILRAVLVFGVTTSLSFSYANTILEWLAAALPGGIESLQAIDVTEPLSVLMRISLLAGFTLALPYIVLELVIFIGEGLHRKTRLFLLFVAIPSSTFLFVLGLAFAYFVMLPTGIPFLISLMSFETNIRASSYVNFATGVLFWLGVVFQLPLVVYILARIGLVPARVLAAQWRLAIVIISIIAAAITPTIDPVNMTVVMLPLIILYFISVGLAFVAERSRRAVRA